MNLPEPRLEPGTQRGPIAWMVRNGVTPNLLMVVLMIGGLLMAFQIKQEIFPEFDLDIVSISVAYPGASPAEVEQGILLSIEEAVRGVDGVDEFTSSANEGSGSVRVELESSADAQKVYQDIQQEVDRITTFPEDAEEPQVSMASHFHEVLDVQLFGDVNERSLRECAEDVRDRLLQSSGITKVELIGARDYEITIEVSTENLRAYGLTVSEIANTIRNTAVEAPGGSMKTSAGEIMVRVNERRDWAREFADIPIVAADNGSILYLRDIAEVREGFEDSDRLATYDGQRSIGLGVYRIGSQTPIGVSDAAHQALEDIEADLPAGIQYAISRDMSDIYRQRLHLLLKNAFFGLTLVFISLTLFLEFKLAFWVVMGIPISFLGTLLFLPSMGVSINMISMFAFIIALGIVVDDAIVAGENIYEYRQRGMSFSQAAIKGAQEVSMPVAFSILTNNVTFLPLLFVPGFMGKIWGVITLVVLTVFSISLVEALLILPVHLAHVKESRNPISLKFHHWQQAFSRFFIRMVNKIYGPFLDACIRVRYLTLSFGLALLAIVCAYALSGRMGMTLMPKVESDRAIVTASLPYGSPMSLALHVRDQLEKAARETVDEVEKEKNMQLAKNIFAEINENVVTVTINLVDSEVRPISTTEATKIWRGKTGSIPAAEWLRFESDRGGPGGGKSLTVELSHRDIDVLERAAETLAERLEEFTNVRDVENGFNPGKTQLDFRLKPEGRSLGLTASGVAQQVRNAFYGAEALRQQRGRNEVTVRVRLPEAERSSEYVIEQMLIRTPSGKDVPLSQIAEIDRGRAYSTIDRRNGRRTISVSAAVEPDDQTNQVIESMNESTLPQLAADFPGLSFSFEGREADMRDSMNSLKRNFVLALLVIYAMLAIPFGSYVQPLIVMFAIPFGFVGAILGHLLMGFNLSVVSMMGIIALSGVVVNDSLVMVVYANEHRRADGLSAFNAIHLAGVRRFRPIMLTTLSTFGGLAPMIFETSIQARFMIPMAISLGYGLLFATAITLLIVPCLYLMIEDVKDLLGFVDESDADSASGLPEFTASASGG
ncbi:efflux RND transporter permease subunit [Candidatus Sumerlaeota bacterium]|nr:efflux RND transporter permease subunit [Candidatus Sumerlaeota bacterium]